MAERPNFKQIIGRSLTIAGIFFATSCDYPPGQVNDRENDYYWLRRRDTYLVEVGGKRTTPIIGDLLFRESEQNAKRAINDVDWYCTVLDVATLSDSTYILVINESNCLPPPMEEQGARPHLFQIIDNPEYKITQVSRHVLEVEARGSIINPIEYDENSKAAFEAISRECKTVGLAKLSGTRYLAVTNEINCIVDDENNPDSPSQPKQ